jgi:hypothetical protein
MSIDWGDAPAYLAIGFSLVAVVITYRFNERQKKFFENQELLNKTLLRQVDAENKEKKQADFGARITALGRSDSRLKIFNQGKAPARNVRLEVLEGDDMFMTGDLPEKFPAERIDAGNGIEVHVVLALNGPRKVKLRLRWEDDHSSHREKVLTAHG